MIESQTIAPLASTSDATAKCPAWQSFLRRSLGDEPAKINLLQEWFGYCMTSDTSKRKLTVLLGPSSAGKETVLTVLGRLVGEHCLRVRDLEGLGAPAAENELANKSVCIVEDVSYPTRKSGHRALATACQAAHGTRVLFKRQNGKGYEHRSLPTRFTLSGEDLPHGGGESLRGFLECLNVVEFKRCLIGFEGPELDEKLAMETAAIAAWAREGLNRLSEQGRFTVPASSARLLRGWSVFVSPMRSFLEECTEPGGEVSRGELFDAWCDWSRERKITQLSTSRFMERICEDAPTAIYHTYEKGGHVFRGYRGIQLKDAARNDPARHA